ncbi:MAG: transcriptional regulator with sensor, AraC family [Planctomycetaceae bacterium]|nr:transcriptional regulator with sensor, AraC family [Planctomycetaceae bacterium]
MKMSTIETSPPLSRPMTSVDVSVIENLFDQVPDVTFFIKDLAGRYITVNDSLVERHGLHQKSQVLGKRPTDICPGDFGTIPLRQDEGVLRTGRPLLDHLELHWYAPHQPGWCLTTKLPMRDSSGKVTGLIGISRDVRAPIETQEIPIRLAEVLDHFKRHLSDATTPSDLARRAQLKSPHFARLMKRFFGLTPSQFIAKARIAAASRLLRETDQSVSDIALACGFYDHSAFTRAFRKMAHVTPTHYRETAGQKKS